jgi:hypothetical protein
MGIKREWFFSKLFMLYAKRSPDLYQVISENAPDAIKTGEIKNHFGRKVAIVCSEHAFFSTICFSDTDMNSLIGCVRHSYVDSYRMGSLLI